MEEGATAREQATHAKDTQRLDHSTKRRRKLHLLHLQPPSPILLVQRRPWFPSTYLFRTVGDLCLRKAARVHRLVESAALHEFGHQPDDAVLDVGVVEVHNVWMAEVPEEPDLVHVAALLLLGAVRHLLDGHALLAQLGEVDTAKATLASLLHDLEQLLRISAVDEIHRELVRGARMTRARRMLLVFVVTVVVLRHLDVARL
jgi:hypothetical protein